MIRKIATGIFVILFLNLISPIMANPTEQEKDLIVIKNLITLRYVLAKLISRMIIIFEAVLQENIGMALRIETQDAIEECYRLLQLLEVRIANKH